MSETTASPDSLALDAAAGDLTAAEEGCSVYPAGRKCRIWSGATAL